MPVSKERKENNSLPIESEREPEELVLCLCHGNVLRSQWAEFLLEVLEIHAASAALGDVTKQHYQDVVPLHIVALMRRHFHFFGPLREKMIKGIDEAIYRRSTHVLVFDDPKHLSDHAFIDPNDLRIRLITTPDPFGKISSYDDVLLEIANKVIMFVRENFPDKLPDSLKERTHLNSLIELEYSLDERISQWTEKNKELTFNPLDRYITSSGLNALGLVDRVLIWIIRRKINDLSDEVENLYPNFEQCQEIIVAIESSDFEKLSQIIQERIDFIERLYRIIERELPKSGREKPNFYHKKLERQIEVIRTLRSDYSSFINYIQRYRVKK